MFWCFLLKRPSDTRHLPVFEAVCSFDTFQRIIPCIKHFVLKEPRNLRILIEIRSKKKKKREKRWQAPLCFAVMSCLRYPRYATIWKSHRLKTTNVFCSNIPAAWVETFPLIVSVLRSRVQRRELLSGEMGLPPSKLIRYSIQQLQNALADMSWPAHSPQAQIKGSLSTHMTVGNKAIDEFAKQNLKLSL